MNPFAHIVHELPGRTRVKVPSQRGSPTYFAQVVERLSTCPAVSAVEANPLTGSVLIRHTGPFSKIAAFAGEGKIFLVTADIASPITVTNRAAANLAWLEGQFTQLSGGRLDLRSAILIGLLALSIAQITRGEIMAPAVTLLWYAVQLMGIDKPITHPTSKDSPNGR